MTEPLLEPCRLCGAPEGTRVQGHPVCKVCGWRVGDVADAEFGPPRIDVVYYVRAGDRVKIGTSSRPRQRLASLRFDELLAFELGDRRLEHARHVEFTALRGTGEWFRLEPPLVAHIHRLAAAGAPWARYARWVAASLLA